MIKRNIKVPIYEWKCRVLVAENHDEVDLVVKELKSLGVDKESIDDVKETFGLGGLNGGMFLSSKKGKSAAIVVLPSSSISESVNTLAHECRHFVDEILRISGIEDMESSAYISGYVYENAFDVFDIKLKTKKEE